MSKQEKYFLITYAWRFNLGKWEFSNSVIKNKLPEQWLLEHCEEEAGYVYRLLNWREISSEMAKQFKGRLLGLS